MLDKVEHVRARRLTLCLDNNFEKKRKEGKGKGGEGKERKGREIKGE